jgi:hypothetical protein
MGDKEPAVLLPLPEITAATYTNQVLLLAQMRHAYLKGHHGPQKETSDERKKRIKEANEIRGLILGLAEEERPMPWKNLFVSLHTQMEAAKKEAQDRGVWKPSVHGLIRLWGEVAATEQPIKLKGFGKFSQSEDSQKHAVGILQHFANCKRFLAAVAKALSPAPDAPPAPPKAADPWQATLDAMAEGSPIPTPALPVAVPVAVPAAPSSSSSMAPVVNPWAAPEDDSSDDSDSDEETSADEAEDDKRNARSPSFPGSAPPSPKLSSAIDRDGEESDDDGDLAADLEEAIERRPPSPPPPLPASMTGEAVVAKSTPLAPQKKGQAVVAKATPLASQKKERTVTARPAPKGGSSSSSSAPSKKRKEDSDEEESESEDEMEDDSDDEDSLESISSQTAPPPKPAVPTKAASKAPPSKPKIAANAPPSKPKIAAKVTKPTKVADKAKKGPQMKSVVDAATRKSFEDNVGVLRAMLESHPEPTNNALTWMRNVYALAKSKGKTHKQTEDMLEEVAQANYECAMELGVPE